MLRLCTMGADYLSFTHPRMNSKVLAAAPRLLHASTVSSSCSFYSSFQCTISSLASSTISTTPSEYSRDRCAAAVLLIYLFGLSAGFHLNDPIT